MAPKRPGLHEAKLQLTRESLSAASGDEEHRKAHLPPRSHEPEDHDITQMAQQMMDAVYSAASRPLTALANTCSDQEKAPDSTV